MVIVPEGSFVVSAAVGRGENSSFYSVFFPIFPVSRKFQKRELFL